MGRVPDGQRYEERRLDAAARPRSIFSYYVTGRGAFPIDMLRHDACWPATGEDAGLLEMEYGTPERLKLRSIKMHSHQAPEIGRWSSFMWSVGLHKINE